MKCYWHLCENEARAKGIYCSASCSTKASILRNRRKQKARAIDYKGGACVRCGYNKSQRALQFHHLNPDEKSFAIGSGTYKSWKKVVVELDKCELICANCHAELHEDEYMKNVGVFQEPKKRNVRPKRKCLNCSNILSRHSGMNTKYCKECYHNRKEINLF